MENNKPVWGLDLGGTKIEGVILESAYNMKVVERMRIPTEGDKGYEHVIGRIKSLVDQMSAKTGIMPESIGLGTPGVLDPDLQTMKNCNSTSLNGKYLKKDLEVLLGMPVRMANDANCFAAAEACLGVVRDEMPTAKVVFGVIMGTGVGGGVVINGKALYGRHGIAGEWGHNFLDASGGECYCGQTGCVETVISGPGLQRYYTSLTGTKISMQEIVRLAKEGKEEAAIKTMQRLVKYFGKSIANVINILDPDAIVLGGGLGNIDLLYTEGVKEVEKHLFNHALSTSFLKPKLGDSAGVFGAALL
jgi:predicted NBD/HSP70 family sugar kinase